MNNRMRGHRTQAAARGQAQNRHTAHELQGCTIADISEGFAMANEHFAECPVCGATIEVNETRSIASPEPEYFLRTGCFHVTTAEQAMELIRRKEA